LPIHDLQQKTNPLELAYKNDLARQAVLKGMFLQLFQTA